MGGWSTLCLPAVRGLVCVVAWAGAESGGSFGAFTQVTVWGMARLLREGRVLYGRVPKNAYSRSSQEWSKVNPGSPLGQPWVPDFWGATVGPRRKLDYGGSR